MFLISCIELKNFRGFSHLKMEDVKPITLISGMNNVGKSSVLDGIFLFFDHIAPDSFVKLNNFRGFPPVSEPKYLWEPIFHNFNTQNNVHISLHLPDGEAALEYMRDDSYVVPEDADVPRNVLNQFISSTHSSYTLKFQYSYGAYKESGHFVASPSGLLRNLDTSLEGNRIQPLPFTQFINSIIIQTHVEIASLLGRLELTGSKGELVTILKLIDSSISDITTIVTESGGAQVYFNMGGRLLPSKLAGDGLNKLMFIILAIMANPNSLILIDEIENGIHYSAYTNLWSVIAATALKYNCQVIASTHSYECIVGAVKGMEDAKALDQFCYFRLDRQENDVTAYRYSDMLLRTAIDTGLEVR